LKNIIISVLIMGCILGRAGAAPQTKAKESLPIKKSSSNDIPDGALDLSDLWPSPLQPAVETDTLALEPASSVTGGNGGASTPSFTGDPSFDGDTFEVNGQEDIVIPYFQMADQMRLDFEDGHRLQGQRTTNKGGHQEALRIEGSREECPNESEIRPIPRSSILE
jgi:hypothetical protein